MFKTTSNYEIDLYLLKYGTVAKIEDADVCDEKTSRPRKRRDRYVLRENAEARRMKNLKIKKARINKLWAQMSEEARRDGADEKPYRIDVWKVAGRVPMGTRRKLAGVEIRLREAGEEERY